jgi:hypothetical protein
MGPVRHTVYIELFIAAGDLEPGDEPIHVAKVVGFRRLVLMGTFNTRGSCFVADGAGRARSASVRETPA